MRLSAERQKSQQKTTDLQLDARGYADVARAFLENELYPAFTKFVKKRARRKLAATGKMALLLKK